MFNFRGLPVSGGQFSPLIAVSVGDTERDQSTRPKTWPLRFEQPIAVRLLGPDDVLDKMLLTLLNPVESGLVKHAEQGPGLWGYRGKIEVERPGIFFRPNGPVPERAP